MKQQNQVAEITLRYNPKILPSEQPSASTAGEAYNILMQNWNADTLQLQEEFKVIPYAHLRGKNEQLSLNTPLTTFSKYSNLSFLTNPANKTPTMTVGEIMRSINDQLIRNGGKPRFVFENYLIK